MPGRMQANTTTHERNASPMKNGDQHEFDGQPVVELLDHVGAVARRDRRQAGDGDLIARMLLADSVQRAVELVDHRQDRAGIEIRHPARHHHRILIGGDEAPDQVLRNHARHIPSGWRRRYCRPFQRASGAASPATRRCRRRPGPPPSNERRRWSAGSPANTATAPLGNSISTSIGLAPVSLASSRPLGCHRLLLVRHLIGQPIARFEIGINHGETADKHHARSG